MVEKGVWVVGTCDTKWQEISFVYELLKPQVSRVSIVDVSTRRHGFKPEIKAEEIAVNHPTRPGFLGDNTDRGDAVACMSEAFCAYVRKNRPMAVIGLGGSGGTSIICAGLRVLPVGIPKIMVSTVASGQVAPYVGASDIFMLYSITDIAGVNQISHTLLSNATNALLGMLQNKIQPYEAEKAIVGMTMFGVTTKGVMQVKEGIEEQFEVLVFHATGAGGRSLEKLVESEMVNHVIDMTTTEICDLHMGGIMSAGKERMDRILRRKIPYILSLGALDMVNFGGIETVPTRYRDRLLYKHNPQVTLMRTSPAENREMGKWIARKINISEGPVRLFIPEKGVSALSVEGQPFYDPEADQELFNTLKNDINQTEDREIISLPYSINDKEFTNAIISEFLALNIF